MKTVGKIIDLWRWVAGETRGVTGGKSCPSRFEQRKNSSFWVFHSRFEIIFAIPIPFFNKSIPDRISKYERERELSSSENGDDNRRYKFPNSLAPLDHAHNSLIPLLLLFLLILLFSKLNWILGFWLLVVSGIMEDRLIFVG